MYQQLKWTSNYKLKIMHTLSMHNFITRDITAFWSYAKWKYLQWGGRGGSPPILIDYEKDPITFKGKSKSS